MKPVETGCLHFSQRAIWRAKPMERRYYLSTIGVVAAMNTTSREPAEILLVDDDPTALAAATTALDSAGHIVYQARDRISALRIARTEALDLVICDVNVGVDRDRKSTRLNSSH